MRSEVGKESRAISSVLEELFGPGYLMVGFSRVMHTSSPTPTKKKDSRDANPSAVRPQRDRDRLTHGMQEAFREP